MLTRRLSLRQSRQVLLRCASSIAINDRAGDAILREAFDRPRSSWRSDIKAAISRPSGLLKNQYLTSPDGFPRFATDSLHKAEFLANYVSEHYSTMSSAAVVKAFDRLSDTLCSVLDLAEFVRNSHPDSRYIDAAEQAYGILYNFMSTLNTHTGLFAALRHISDSRERHDILDKEQKAVLDVLLADFYRSGVHLDSDARTAFVKLSSEIAEAERRAFTDYAPRETEVQMSISEARGFWPNPDRSLMTNRGESLRIPTSGRLPDNALQMLEHGNSRRRLATAMQSHTEAQLENMNYLFRARGKLAKVVGSQSHGNSVLARQMARSPSQVEHFLMSLSAHVVPKAQAEMEILKREKRKHLRTTDAVDIHWWDEDYYMARHIQSLNQTISEDLSPYLSVGTVIQGLSRLFDQIYGVRFLVRDLESGEAWHKDVQCLDVISERDGLIGALYCDLFSRPGKDSGLAAHFTVRCGRKLDNDMLLPGEPDVESGMLTGTLNGDAHQLPVVALQCDFTPAAGNNFASLSFHEVSTLFHEMGHAIHSMLGTTAYQTISGTRVAADMVELPSQIMESFAESAAVWPLFARHYATDRPAPEQLLRKVIAQGGHFPGIAAHRQLMRSLLDQRYHSALATHDEFEATAVLRDLNAQFRLTCEADPTLPWQIQFTHLVGYGATYYSYIFDKAMAEQIWHKTFRTDPLSREAGENFKMNLLRYGGSRDPWACLADVLKEPELALGDANAMARVGQWSLRGKSMVP